MPADETTNVDFTADDAIMEMLQNDGLVQSEEEHEPESDEQEVEQDSYEDVDPDDDDDEEYEAEDDDGGEEYEPEEDSEEQQIEAENLVEINGENIPLDELKAGYQRQSDYTRKTQELAEQRKALAALEGLGNILASDPTKAAQIAAIVRGEQMPQQQEQEPQRPEDPIEAMRWDIKQELLQELAPQLQNTQAQMQTMAQANAVQQTLAQFQRDPQWNEARAELDSMLAEKVAKEGIHAGNEYFARLDGDPQFFAQEFGAAKQRVAAKGKAKKPVPKKKGSPRLADTRSGNGKKTTKQKARQREISALKSGDADAIFDVVAAGGGFGNLFGNKG